MNTNFLKTTVLFSSMDTADIDAVLLCLEARRGVYERGQVIYHAGECVSALGLVLEGGVHIESDDIWGNKTLLDYVGSGRVFAESYACLPREPLMVSVVAAEKTEVLFLNAEKTLSSCSEGCAPHARLIRNLLTISAQKNLALSRRSLHTSPKSIRGKLLSYLSSQAVRQGGEQFEIPFNRQQLADYLGVDRSALSGELSRMRQEGLISYHKNVFCLNVDGSQ